MPGVTKKKIDSRVKTLLENGVKNQHRSFIVIVGDKARDQIVNLHYLLSRAQVKTRPSVLWCYKNELEFSTNKKKRLKRIKKQMARGLHDATKDDPFDLFVTSTNIRYCYYKDTHKILGNTYGMCVLQDFEAMTPNVLARTTETVEGGGLVLLLLKSIKSLRQLYTMSLDAHSRLRSARYQDVVGRFTERFILSLASCSTCLVVDDTLNILPISSHIRKIKQVEHASRQTPEQRELESLKNSLASTEIVGPLVARCKTVDQAKSLLVFIEAISEKTLRSTVTLTAARGRGKSASLGLSIACAIGMGYSNIFVTSPNPENLKTLFDFVFKGFDALQYAEHADYDLIQSTNPAFHGAIVRVNVFHAHRQTIQYIHPSEAHKVGQAELVVVDEAAAIPLPYVRKMFGPHLLFLSSTVNGYEGTGRSLSLKLIKGLREASNSSGTSARVLKELTLEEPIRYAAGDPVEDWLTRLLCLDSTIPRAPGGRSCPHPSTANLYYVNKDALFSFHKQSEAFLQRIMALFVSSHYKNSPDDLLLLSDAPAHHLFVLLGPIDPSKATQIPEVLCAVQVALEGGIARPLVQEALKVTGKTGEGDLIPWNISQQYQDEEFASLNGGRVVRIATHPSYQSMGYGTRALQALADYYSSSDAVRDLETLEAERHDSVEEAALPEDNLLLESVKPRKLKATLLSSLSERKPEALDYLGTSFGVTLQLYKFWQRNSYVPLYVRLTPNSITGEHSCIMLRALRGNTSWLTDFYQDFQSRFSSLLSFDIRSFSTELALRILGYDPTSAASTASRPQAQREEEQQRLKAAVSLHFSPYDRRRLESYSRRLLDYHVILDMLPALARLYFLAIVPRREVSLNWSQASILLGMGLQSKSIDQLMEELSLPSNQMLAFFNKAMVKFAKWLRKLEEREVAQQLPEVAQEPHLAVDAARIRGMAEELEQAGEEARADLDERFSGLRGGGAKYAIEGGEEDWKEALKSAQGGVPGVVAVKRKPAGSVEGTPSASKKSRSSGSSHKKKKKKKKHRK